MTSSKRRNSAMWLEEQMRELTTAIEGQPRASMLETGNEVEAHNGKSASRYEANQLLMSRLVHGFDRSDGPVVCILGSRCRGCDKDNGYSCPVKRSWVRDLFSSQPDFTPMPHRATIEDILSAQPSVVVAAEDYPLPRRVPGYIRVRLRAFRYQMLFKIKE